MSLSRSAIVAAAAAALALPAGATAASPVPKVNATPAAKTANRLIAKAIARADRRAVCKDRSGAWVAEPLGDTPDPGLVARLAPLRRPAQAGDAMPPTPLVGFALYEGASRRVTADDGTVGYLTVGRSPLPGPSRACMLRQQVEIVKAARTARRAVRVLLDRKAHELRLLAAQKATDTALLFRADGAFAGGLDAVGARQASAVFATTSSAAGESRVLGFATDDVASVTFLAAVGGPVTVPVHDNVFSAAVAFDPKAYPRFELRDAAGALLRTIG